MNEYKTKLILSVLLLLSFILLFCTFYKIDDFENCAFTNINDNYLIVSQVQLPTTKSLLFRINDADFYGRLSLLEYNGKEYLYTVSFKGNPNLHIVQNISILKGQVNVFEYIIDSLRSSF